MKKAYNSHCKGDKIMNIILMGPPGAGKELKLLNWWKNMGLKQISTGDLFRKAIKEETKIWCYC